MRHSIVMIQECFMTHENMKKNIFINIYYIVPINKKLNKIITNSI